ncbi:energy-coupling factor ABC transporter ATP-binding protein [Fredinandcohnia humi]
MPLIEVKNVSYFYRNGNKALENVSLLINQSESVAIIGQNGAGKTTLVKLIKGLMKPSDGNIIVDSHNTKDYTTAQLADRVGYVFQNPDDQIFHNDVYSEIAFGPKKIKLDEETIKENVKWAAELCNLSDHLNDNPFDLPLSIRKFVTIASIIAMKPKIIILDEPTAGQDKKGIQILSHMIRILSERGFTIITITHDMEFVASNFTRTVVMANKRIIMDNNTNEIFWNREILTQAKLQPPHIIKLLEKVGISKKELLKMDEVVDHLMTLL